MSDYYAEEIYPWTVPILLPVAQISLTASVYTTVVTCFDRYIAICRPALLGKTYNHSTLQLWRELWCIYFIPGGVFEDRLRPRHSRLLVDVTPGYARHVAQCKQ